MKRLLVGLLVVITLSASWSYKDKKTPDKTLTITQVESGEDLRAYLWLPNNYDSTKQYPAVVLVHGCGGAHYKDEPDEWIAKYVAGKYKVWGKLLNDNGFIVLLVDSFTTRDDNGDVGGGVCNTSDPLDRPSKIDPVTVRAGDIASAISYLKSRDDIIKDKVGVLSFSNGATSALIFANHESIVNRADELNENGKLAFDIPLDDDYKASKIVALYPGCGLNGYSSETQNIFNNKFETDTETYIFMASDDTILPPDTKDKCNHLEALDQNKTIDAPTMKLIEVNETDHQFDYYENDEDAVKDAIDNIISIFKSM